MFEWDPRKAETNAARHGVRFEDAATVFDDANALDGDDRSHSGIEQRRLRVGRSNIGRILTVAYTFRRHGNEEVVRIISARAASRKERRAYASIEY